MPPPPQIAFDVTHLVSRLTSAWPSGIDKVDMAYALHFAASPCAAAVHYGVWRPRIHAGRRVDQIVETATSARWAGTRLKDDAAYERVEAWLRGGYCGNAIRSSVDGRRPLEKISHRLMQVSWRMKPGSEQLHAGTIYLNVAQHAFEYARFFEWLGKRPEIKPVFLLHDLLPLDYPEYFRPSYRARFERRFQTVLQHAAALITTSQDVAERATREYAARGKRAVPIHVEPLPSSLPGLHLDAARDPQLAAIPYFVVLGTIEPRKNHLLLLNVWRQLALEQKSPPKLVIVGARGWENEQVWDVLDRGCLTRPHVLEVSGLGDAALVRLISNARGLLMPSFAEGYGLPVVEALSLGTPVVASDLPVFREISQSCALLRHPLDGPGWRRLIQGLADRDSSLAGHASTLARSFRPPGWASYFRSIEAFLGSL